MRKDEVIPRALAFLVGVGLAFFLPATLILLLGGDSPLVMPVITAAYGVIGAALGFLWPRGGWRLGLYLFAFWLPMLLFAAFLAGEVPWDWKATSRDLLGYLMILVVACFGAEVGAIIRRRRPA